MGRSRVLSSDEALKRKRERARQYYYQNRNKVRQKYYNNQDEFKQKKKQYYLNHKEQHKQYDKKLREFKDYLYYYYKFGLLQIDNNVLPDTSLNSKNKRSVPLSNKDKKILIRLLCKLYNERKVKLSKKEKHKIKAAAREERKKVVIKIIYRKYKNEEIEI